MRAFNTGPDRCKKKMKMLRHGLAVAVIVSILYITSFISIGSRSRYNVSKEDITVLQSLQKDFTRCVEKNGIGMHVEATDFCSVRLSFANDTEAKWKDPKTGELEPLQYDFNLCEALSLWEQVRNSSTILTKEYIDFLPNGWEDYAWRRINKGITLNKCANKTLCMEKLSSVLPKLPPFVPHQYGRCAVIGNSGDLLKTRLGQEIDSFDAVIRGNGAPTENYTEYVGSKRTFRLLNRGSAKALDKVAAMDDTKKEVLIIKTTIHDTMSKMIKEVPIANPVYLMLGTSLGSSAKGTGIKALEFALSICETVDIYGFTVDPGYTEWSRYFSESRGGHTPLLGRAYYQMMECLGLIRIHSPMRLARDKKLKEVPKKSTIESARRASERVLGKTAFGKGDPLAGCLIWAKRNEDHFQNLFHLREPARNHHRLLNGVTQYPLEHSSANGLLCVKPSRKEEMMSK